MLCYVFRIKEPGYLSGITLDDEGFESWQGLGIFLFATASGTHPASYTMIIRSSFTGDKAAGA
jgi:hypothetical protein